MKLGTLLRGIDALANFAAGGGGGREGARDEGRRDDLPANAPGFFEARMAGVLISALREAFNRDSERLQVEREQVEAERQRAEQALRLEMARQATEREASHLRAIGAVAVIVWVMSVVFLIIHPAVALAAKVALAVGWALLLVALGAIVAAHSGINRWLGEGFVPGVEPATGGARAAAPWLVLSGLALTSVSLLLSLA